MRAPQLAQTQTPRQMGNKIHQTEVHEIRQEHDAKIDVGGGCWPVRYWRLCLCSISFLGVVRDGFSPIRRVDIHVCMEQRLFGR